MSDRNNHDKLEELKQRAKEKFTPEEIDKFINMGSKLANKVIYDILEATVREGPSKGCGTVSQANKIAKKIAKAAPKTPGLYLSIDLSEFGTEFPYSALHIILAPKQRDYVATIDIPEQYVNDLYAKYNLLKNVAVATWRQICQDQPVLIKLVREFRSDVDFNEIHIDEKCQTSLYFDPNCAIRVSIFPYYVGKDGKNHYAK